MIRRTIVALAALILAAPVAAGCTTFSANRNAATVNGTDLPVSRFEAYLQGYADNPEVFQIAPAGAAGLPGDIAREILDRWILNTLRSSALADRGASVTPQQRKTVEDQILAGGAASVWGKLNADTQAYVLDAQSVQPAFDAEFGADANIVLGKLVDSAHVTIDSRYGMWEPATILVVPTR